MPDERLSKNQRREQARELARVEREKQKRRERLLRWVIPSSVTVVVLAIVAVVVVVVVTSAPAPQTKAGPKNMITDGIVFTGQDGKAVPTKTPALKAKVTPSPSKTDSGSGVVNIITYVDLACPVCQSFEQTNSETIQSMVASGKATLEVKPVAILDRNYQSSRYSSRINDAAACVANYDPDDFLTMMSAAYANQPSEGSSGLTNSQIIAMLHKAGVNNGDVDKCINGERFKSWMAAATSRATSDPSLVNPSNGSFGTPTVLVDGQLYTGAPNDADAFQQFLAEAAAS